MSERSEPTIGFHHAGVVVSDLDKAIEFYTELFGFEVYNRSSWSADNETFNTIIGLKASAAQFCMLKGHNAYLELFQYSSPAASNDPSIQGPHEPGIRHLAFAVPDVNKTLARCVEFGGEMVNEPVAVPGGATATYCRDPFGNIIELVSPGGRFPKPFSSVSR